MLGAIAQLALWTLVLMACETWRFVTPHLRMFLDAPLIRSDFLLQQNASSRHVPSSQHVGKLVLSLKLLKVCQKLPDPDQSACLSGVLESRPTKTSRL